MFMITGQDMFFLTNFIFFDIAVPLSRAWASSDSSASEAPPAFFSIKSIRSFFFKSGEAISFSLNAS